MVGSGAHCLTQAQVHSCLLSMQRGCKETRSGVTRNQAICPVRRTPSPPTHTPSPPPPPPPPSLLLTPAAAFQHSSYKALPTILSYPPSLSLFLYSRHFSANLHTAESKHTRYHTPYDGGAATSNTIFPPTTATGICPRALSFCWRPAPTVSACAAVPPPPFSICGRPTSTGCNRTSGWYCERPPLPPLPPLSFCLFFSH
jgi:hypothetical protein